MTECLRLNLKSSLAEIATLAKAFEAFADRNSLTTATRLAANLALEEVVTNIIVHGCKGQEDRVITVEVTRHPQELELTVEDTTPPFDPLQVPPPNLQVPLEERQPGGLGIHLVRRMMDRMEYHYANGKNKLRMSRKLNGTVSVDERAQ